MTIRRSATWRVLLVAALAVAQPSLATAQARAVPLLREIQTMLESGVAASRAAEQAADVAGVRAGAEQVFTLIWGMSSGIDGARSRAERVPGWKERWQVSGAEYDPRFVERYGKNPPRITDPTRLGTMGRGRAARAQLQRLVDDRRTPATRRAHAEHAIAALNNAIGWMVIREGLKGTERQPRIDLTYVWDAPSEFWVSSADTGWLLEAEAQAANILRTDYAGDVAAARSHVAALTRLLQRALDGVDADGNGAVEPKMMEGAVRTAVQHAAMAGGR